ncbi:hypothetical protein KSK37_12220 [Kaistella sp. DKR-2]|uniref:MauE/DoxX family redox-associated membrane protein n=1 Tax=Kaistella soli TaxID=2849654 RepID=UPI001C2595A7|nr:MauE/DoxX family redox-associated membrane protein [Kaistella soli]MBU8883852.1 hypothetical protein [Kaistella soli]
MKNLIKIMPFAISLFFAVLFSYAAMSKATGFKNFRSQLEQAPGVEGYGGPVAYGIIALLTVCIIMLCYRPLRFWGLWITLVMLTVFAGYTAVILIAKKEPCTCIGLFEKMNWKENLALNIGLMITALVGIISMRTGRDQNKKDEKHAHFSE